VSIEADHGTLDVLELNAFLFLVYLKNLHFDNIFIVWISDEKLFLEVL
jgi:hypothetical protein